MRRIAANITAMPWMPLGAETSGDAATSAWRQWRSTVGAAKDLAAQRMLDALSGQIFSAVNQYRAAGMPGPALELEAKRQALLACGDYLDGSGTLTGFVATRVKQRLYDYVSRHQNVATIPAEHIRRIGSFGRAVDDLTDKFGREPTTHELADHLGVAPKKITALRKAYRPVTLESSDDSFESAVDDASRERVLLAYYGLTDQEKLVFDYSLGAHGQPKLSTKEIATKLRVTDARVSNLKATLATKLAPYLDT